MHLVCQYAETKEQLKQRPTISNKFVSKNQDNNFSPSVPSMLPTANKEQVQAKTIAEAIAQHNSDKPKESELGIWNTYNIEGPHP